MKGRMMLTVALFVNLCIALGMALGMQDEVRPGDKVRVHLDCWLRNGELALTTREQIANNDTVPKSVIFLPRRDYAPMELLALNGEQPPRVSMALRRGGFEGEIAYRLGPKLVGMKIGERRLFEVSSEIPKSLRPEDRFIKLSRIRVRPKEMRIPLDQFQQRTGKDPHVGLDFYLDPAIPGRVTRVTETDVVVSFTASPGQTVKTPIGPGVIWETEGNFEIHVQSKRGDVVRSGPMVGRVVDVEDRMITIDYGHPFGGEVLRCHVEVLSVER